MKDLENRECCYNCRMREVVPSNGPVQRVSYCERLRDIIDYPEKFICNFFEPTSSFITNFVKHNTRKRINFREVEDE